MGAAAHAAGSPYGVGGKKRPKEALLPTYGIGLVANGYSGQPDSAAQKIAIILFQSFILACTFISVL